MHVGARLHRGEVTGRDATARTAPYRARHAELARRLIGTAVFWLVVAMLLPGSPRVAAQPADPFAAAGTDAPAVERFLGELQRAVAADDRAAVLALFACPCTVWDGQRRRHVHEAGQIRPFYDAVFDAGLKQQIAAARVGDLFANWQGVMLGDGRLWFTASGSDGRLGISTVNAPAAGR